MDCAGKANWDPSLGERVSAALRFCSHLEVFLGLRSYSTQFAHGERTAHYYPNEQGIRRIAMTVDSNGPNPYGAWSLVRDTSTKHFENFTALCEALDVPVFEKIVVTATRGSVVGASAEPGESWSPAATLQMSVH